MILPTSAAKARPWRGSIPLTLLWVVIAGGAWACGGKSSDLDIGSAAPSFIEGSRGNTLALIARVEDCISCGLRDAFVAVRVLEGAVTPSGPGLDVALWIVTSNPSDTIVVRQLLTRQRLILRISVIRPAVAWAVFQSTKIPAVYLIQSGLVVREWEAGPGGDVVVARNDFAEALR